jgi:hypothetical protein
VYLICHHEGGTGFGVIENKMKRRIFGPEREVRLRRTEKIA